MNKFIILLAAIVAISFGVYSYQQKKVSSGNIAEQLNHATYLYDQKSAIANYQLTDHNNNIFTPDSIKGAWTFWFFGFTHCPDICPITLGTLSASVNKLKTEHNIKDKIKIVFVSVDPERDNIEALKTYVSAFSQDAIGVTADDEKLAPFLKNMGIIAIKQDNDGKLSDYLIDHSSAVYLIAPDTGISAYFGAPHEVKNIVEDFLTIQKFYK